MCTARPTAHETVVSSLDLQVGKCQTLVGTS